MLVDEFEGMGPGGRTLVQVHQDLVSKRGKLRAAHLEVSTVPHPRFLFRCHASAGVRAYEGSLQHIV